MAQQGFTTDTSTVTAIAGQLDGMREDLGARMVQLRGQLEPLAQQWQGRGGTAFQLTMAQWDRDARTINGSLEAIISQVRQAAVQHDVSEDEAAQLLRALGGDGGGAGGAGGGAPTGAGGGISAALDGPRPA